MQCYPQVYASLPKGREQEWTRSREEWWCVSGGVYVLQESSQSLAHVFERSWALASQKGRNQGPDPVLDTPVIVVVAVTEVVNDEGTVEGCGDHVDEQASGEAEARWVDEKVGRA